MAGGQTALMAALLLETMFICCGANSGDRTRSPPGQPNGAQIYFDEVRPTSAIVRWHEPALGRWQWPIQGYRIRMNTQRTFPKVTTSTFAASHPDANATVSEWVELTGVSSAGETDYQGETWFRVSNLEPDVLYRFSVKAFNLDGAGEWSAPSYALHTHAKPEAPQAASALDQTHNAVLLEWSPPATRGTLDCPDIAHKNIPAQICTTAGTGSNVTGFRIYIKNSPSTDSGNYVPLTLPVSGLKVGVVQALQYLVRGCEPGTEYGFRISAINAAGESDLGEPLHVRTNGVPDATGHPEIYAKTHTSIALMWEPAKTAPQSPVLGYRLFGGRWDWEFSRWVPISPSVLSIAQRQHVSYDDLVVEHGESPYPWPQGMDPSEWGELELPNVAILTGTPTADNSTSANVVEDSGWDWPEYSPENGPPDGWVGRRRLARENRFPRFEGASWAQFAGDDVHHDLHRRRLQTSNNVAFNTTNNGNITSGSVAGSGTSNLTQTTFGYAHDMYIRPGFYYDVKPTALRSSTLYYNVKYLMNNQYYRFKVVAINAAGQSTPSAPSQVEKLLDSPISSVSIFAGAPCLHRDQRATDFLAVSDGSGVYYRWTTELGNTAGICQTADCAHMKYQFVDVGVNMILVTAINNVGSKLQTMTVNVSYCGCSDRADPNYWWLATYHLPKSCASVESWPDVDKRVAMGQIKYFDLPIPADAYQTQLVIRVQTGAVGVYISSTELPDILSSNTYDQRFIGPQIRDRTSGNLTGTYTGITTFQIMDTYYTDLSDYVAGQLTGAKWMYVAVVGFDSFSQFDLVGKISQFTKASTCQGNNICVTSATRRNLQNPFVNMTVATPYFDFYEYYFEAAQMQQRIDIEVKLTILEGCATLYASQTERYPSPKRAGGAEYGYMTDKSVGGCVGSSANTGTAGSPQAPGVMTPELSVVFNIEAQMPRVLYLSVQGTDMANLAYGQKPPMSIYSIEVVSFNYNQQSQVVDAQLTMEAGQETQDVVIEDNFKFFEIRVSDAATVIDVTVTTVFGEVDLYISSAGKPTQSIFDVRVRDTDGDSIMFHQLKFSDIEMDGFFYIGVFGQAPSSSFFVNVDEVRLDANEVLTIVSQEYIDSQDFVNATSGGPECTQIGDTCHQLSGYKYFKADREITVVDPTSNTSVSVTADATNDATNEQSVFDWTGPYTADYLEANFNSRTSDLIVQLTVSGLTHQGTWYPASYLGTSQTTTTSPLYTIAQEPVIVTVYGSSLDPFPGHLRTHDVLASFDLRSQYNVLLSVPLFQWSILPVYFSVHSPVLEIHYDFVVSDVDFDRSILLSEDPVLPPGLCPGQSSSEDIACSGHGSCVGAPQADAPLPPTCFCNAGWLGPSCAVERFPDWPLVQILSPNASVPAVGTVENGVVVKYVTPMHPNDTMVRLQAQKQYWDDVDLVLYVDGKPYPQPYPNNMFPVPDLNESIPTQFSIHNLLDGAPHNIQLYVMYTPEYAVLQTISLDFYLNTVGPGCTTTADCSSHGSCYRGYCVCFDGWVGSVCALPESNTSLTALNATSQGYRDRLVSALERKAIGVAYETSVMIESAENYMNKQDASLLLRLQEAVDYVNAGRLWNKETVEYFLTKYGNEADQKAVERATSLASLSAEFDQLDHSIEELEELLDRSREDVEFMRKGVVARLAQLRQDYEWERRVKYAEWRMVKERALFNMLEVQHANGPRVPIDKLQEEVCTRDSRFRTECHQQDRAQPTVTTTLQQTDLMVNYDVSGTIYAKYNLHAIWDESLQIQICNATCHGILDPCESEALTQIFQLNCSNSMSGQYVNLGYGFCRDPDGIKPNGYYKRLASSNLCAQYCDLGATCIGYAWSSTGMCYLYYSDYVAQPGQDFSELYEFWHIIPTGWNQFVPQGSTGSSHLVSGDGSLSRTCYAKASTLPSNSTSTNTSGSDTPTAPEPEPEPSSDWLNQGVSFGALLPSTSGTPVLIGNENNLSNATTCWTGQQLVAVVENNLASGSAVLAVPPGDVPSSALADSNLDRNWHSQDGLNATQLLRITLPGSGLHCISGLKLYWRNVYTAKTYTVNSSTDGQSYTTDILQGAASNLPAQIGRIDEYSFALHDAKYVQLSLLEKQTPTTLDFDLLEVEVYGITGKCNDTFGHEPQINATAQLDMLLQMQQQLPTGSSGGGLNTAGGSVLVGAAHTFNAQCTPMPGTPLIDANGGTLCLVNCDFGQVSDSLWCADWNCGSLGRGELLQMCKTVTRQAAHPAPPMDPGPKVSN